MEMMNTVFVMISEEELKFLKETVTKILQKVEERSTLTPNNKIPVKYIPALEFMTAIDIKRTKFDELVKANKIKIVKKKRKIYVLSSEIDRYFSDESIQ